MTAWTLISGVLIGVVSGFVLWECLNQWAARHKSQEDSDGNANMSYTIFKLSIDPIPLDDFTRLIDLRNFTYKMNQPECASEVQALILVPSAPDNLDKRRLIRRTWANMVELPHLQGSTPFRVIFLLGLPVKAEKQLELERENFEYGDMVQGSFFDHYKNMTYKHVMALKWFLFNCAHAQILIKVDDDVFLNTPQLLIYLHNAMLHNALPQKAAERESLPIKTDKGTHTAVDATAVLPNDPHIEPDTNEPTKLLFRRPRDLLFCKLRTGVRVSRSYRHKWRTGIHEYGKPFFPPYCPGYAIIYSTDVAQRLYEAAQKAKYFWIDDVHITGILAGDLNISITPASPYILHCRYGKELCNLLSNGSISNTFEDILCMFPVIKSTQMYDMWNLQLERVKEKLSDT